MSIVVAVDQLHGIVHIDDHLVPNEVIVDLTV